MINSIIRNELYDRDILKNFCHFHYFHTNFMIDLYDIYPYSIKNPKNKLDKNYVKIF